MIDIHSHIIYGIDDGCKTLDESIQTILNLKKIGFDKLILTRGELRDKIKPFYLA